MSNAKSKKVGSYDSNLFFIGEVKKQQKILHLTYRELSEITGIPMSTLGQFMSGYRDTKGVKETLAETLKIDLD